VTITLYVCKVIIEVDPNGVVPDTRTVQASVDYWQVRNGIREDSVEEIIEVWE